MLVLTRKTGEKIVIGDDITITILDVRGDGIRIGIDAPAASRSSAKRCCSPSPKRTLRRLRQMIRGNSS